MPLIINNNNHLSISMPPPRVFISSTCYDFGHIRDSLENFVKSLGYIPIRSDRGSIYFDTNKDVMDACIDDVPNCQMLVSIIGGQFGNENNDTGKSITNMEVDKAREAKIPIFTLVDNKVMHQYNVWKINKEKDIKYPDVQSTKIFEFIEEVKNASVNNALHPFDTFEDIRSYLLQQWSGMLHHFLTSESEAKKVDETLTAISEIGKKIEFITRQIASVTIPKKDKANIKIKIMDIISKELIFPLITLKKHWNISFTPEEILQNNTLEKLIEKNNFKIKIETFPGKDGSTHYIMYPSILVSNTNNIKHIIPIGKDAMKSAEEQYKKLREKIISILKENDISEKEFLSED